LIKFLLSFLLSFSIHFVVAQDFLGFSERLSGEEITYFSPFRQFANQALLTRCNGSSAIEWLAQTPALKEGKVFYRFLIGFSSGTSAADRNFDFYLNGKQLFTFITKKSWVNERFSQLGCNFAPESNYRFSLLEKDINKDMFGYLEIELPFQGFGQNAVFKAVGQDAQSRDWLMVFDYQDEFKTVLTASNLILRAEQMRPLNLECLIPEVADSIQVRSSYFNCQRKISAGYQALSFAAYPTNFIGQDQIEISLFSSGKIIANKQETLEILPIKNLQFHIIHHSHNDIGYSHLQTEVAKIQTENIRSALRWIAKGGVGAVQPIWHIESLWAVENFLAEASAAEEGQFVAAVKSGNLVLSANYANCLTGLMRPEEFVWLTEYAWHLKQKYGIHISNAMVTDIPGQTYAAFEAYAQQQIPYLSLGPNYVANHADHGDRVGGVIRETGDQPFMWQSKTDTAQQLFVWTAGKGYSYFHNIAAGRQFFEWEKRLSTYTQELAAYPYNLVQLRYTKNADNGPVDTTLCEFVAAWNLKYSSPQLVLSNVDTLFADFLKQYKDDLPVQTGEISPYWEDGAYSTAAEEIQARRLVQQVIKFEKQLLKPISNAQLQQLRAIHRNLVLFHEHTWGSWCSISAPDTYFTTEQWRIKKAFLDSAQILFDAFKEELQWEEPKMAETQSELELNWDKNLSGIRSLKWQGQELLSQDSLGLGGLIYSLGLAPQVNSIVKPMRTDHKANSQQFEHPNLKVRLEVWPSEAPNELILHYTIDKKAIRDKEALHICLPFNLVNPKFDYGEQTLINYPADQLAGSNKEFICVADHLVLEDKKFKITVFTPDCNLIELAAPVNEQQQRGAKVWTRENQSVSPLYLYVFNNYWHTNYKADQAGNFDLFVRVRVEGNLTD
jgi:alpha-mannosidase